MIGTDSYHIVIDLANSLSDTTTIDITEINTNMGLAPIEPIRAKLIGNGVIRLFREFEHDDAENVVSTQIRSNPGDDTMVSIIAVPTYFTATDLLGFIGENYMSDISHIRILKSDKPNRFLVLIKFRDIVKTAEFQYHYNGKPFNSMEPETCHVVYVKSVQLRNPASNETASDAMIPFLLQDPFTSSIAADSSSTSTTTAETSHLIELPTCPVCLERMDATVTGLLTIPCQHTFHCQCLTKWKDDTCPVCRYSHNMANERVRRSTSRLQHLNIRESSLTPPSRPPTSLLQQSENDAGEVCMECDQTDNLWICLICGNVGCGRYAPAQHSLKHFINTGHCFAMEIDTSRVWDYAGDKYVHRLVTNESDGKLVELPDKEDKDGNSSSRNNNSYYNANGSDFDKVDEVGFEYSQLLISQLASQREYYESLINEQRAPKSRRGSSNVKTGNNNSTGNSNDNQEALTELEIKVEDLTSKLSDFTINLIPSLKEKIQAKDEKLNKVMRELNIATSLNDALSKKIEHLNKVGEEHKKTIEALTDENKGLNEQVTDLMFFLDSQEKFKNESQEVKDGTIVIQQLASTLASRKNRRKKK
ncbi:RING finger protein ETP1 [Candida viswanathii]|uniref:RING finger protein ETP1 n=1 Tax=Candida viswanathii TaxID=5486 RepID=A0A367XMJ2_9ASCO|nr:RING finger protein ETP1 [Candida viswanathii]